MNDPKVRRTFSMAICAAMLFSTVVLVSFPKVSATPGEWTEWSFDDFSDSTSYSNVAVNGVPGGDGNITLVREPGWHETNPATNPGRRDGFGFAFDSKNCVAVLFGGYSYDEAKKMNDLWEYDYITNTWTEIIADGTVGSPPRRDECRMDYDSANEVIVLWGGVNDTSLIADTWEYDVDTHTWVGITPISSPPAMGGYALAYDSVNQRILLAGTYETPPGGSLHMYAYDASASPREWVERASRGDSPRAGHDMAFHVNEQVMVVKGGEWGMMGEIEYDDTLLYDYGTDSWTRYDYDGDMATVRPGYRINHALARYYNDVIFMGGYDGFMYYNDCWIYVGGYDGWQDVTPLGLDPIPPARHKHRIVWDSCHSVLILYGGSNDMVHFNDTWVMGDGYVSGGWYVSKCDGNHYFDSGLVYVEWLNIWWNDTLQPTGTKLKFQLQSDTDGDPATPPNATFVGPDGTESTFYETPGQNIGGHHNGKQYIRYKAYFEGTTSQTPILEDITISYTAEGSPYIISTDPADQETAVPVSKDITVVFSESMNTSTLTWTISPDPSPGSWSEVWGSTYEPYDTVTFVHPVPLEENTQYIVEITYAEDLDGNPLNASLGEPNPWTFTTECIGPWLVDTYPADGDYGVPLDVIITVNFSEPMNTSSVSWTFTSNPIPSPPLYGNWSNGNTTLTLTHTVPLSEGQQYTVHISGKDLKGNPLDPNKGVPNPWRFYTGTDQPFVFDRDPENGEQDVPLGKNIVITFSEPMNTTTVAWLVSTTYYDGPPIDLGWTESWEQGDTVLNISHSIPFDEYTTYFVNVTYGEDMDGNPLNRDIGLPQWWFKTESMSPWILWTDPFDGESGVAIDRPIIVTFSEPINKGTVSWTISPSVSLTPSWNPQDTMLTLDHPVDFMSATTYVVEITYAEDMDGNPLDSSKGAPNPWEFYTGPPAPPAPYIVSTDPAHTTTGVALDKNITVTFSKEMDANTVALSFDPAGAPDPGGWTKEWTPDNLTFFFNHTNPFTMERTYWANITGNDTLGIPLDPGTGAPNPWWFSTGFHLPYIVSTDPYDNEIEVEIDRPIIVTFNESINKSTVTWSISPYIALAKSWNANCTVLTLTHSDSFLSHWLYEVEITHAEDLDGNPLDPSKGVPNPWHFVTGLGAPRNLRVERSPPNHVVIRWDPVPGDIDGYRVYISNDRFAKWTWGWSVHTCPAPPFTHEDALNDGANYFYIVRAYQGTNESDNSTMGGKAHLTFETAINRWQFSINWISLPYKSMYHKASDIVMDIGGGSDGPTKILFVLKWNRDLQRIEFYYYSRGKWWGDDFKINPGDGIAIGGIMQVFAWYINGTDIDYELSFKQGRTDWISMPYTSPYVNASDIVMDIEGGLGLPTKITEVGKWNASGQKYEIYRWDGVAWTGDFTINVGEGIYLHSISDFDWTPKLLTPAVS